MSEVADQVLYQARRVTGKVAGISNNLVVLQQAGVSVCAPQGCWRRLMNIVMLNLLIARCCGASNTYAEHEGCATAKLALHRWCRD